MKTTRATSSARSTKKSIEKPSAASPTEARETRSAQKTEIRQFAEKIRRKLKGRERGRTWQWAFLEVLARSGNVTLACFAADIERQTAYQLRKREETFRELWEAALEMAADRLEEEAWRRACEGLERYVVSQGKIVLGPDGKPLIERHFSDMLLDRLLRAARPEKFRDSYGITGDVTSIVKVYYGFDPDKV